MRQAPYNKTNRWKVPVLFTTILFSIIIARPAHAATLYLSPSNPNASIGNIVTMKVLVNTEGKSINNVESTIQFPADLLEVVSLSKASSIFSLWVEEPKFSNISGTITLNGGVPNPGYVGSAGEIVSVVFRAKKSGVASVVFSDSAVRQNDGLGTDILTTKALASVSVEALPQVEVPAVNTAANSLPPKPVIVSPSHPNQDTWYQNTTATFNWTIPDDVTSIQTLLSKSPTATPTITYDSSVSQRTVSNLSDGILYFHIRFYNSLGWGPVAHYKIQVDSTSPDKFTVNNISECKNSSASVGNSDGLAGLCERDIISLNAFDALSGIDSYSIKIDGRSPFSVKKDSLTDSSYILPVLEQGRHDIVVVAYDKAGNSTQSQTVISSGPIEIPSISVDSARVKRGENFTVYGNARYADTGVNVYVETSDGKIANYTTKSSADGKYSYKTADMKVSGTTKVWVEGVFDGGIKGPISEKAVVQVLDGPIVATSKSVIYSMSFVIPAVVMILGLILLAYVGWHRFFGLKRKLNKELQGAVGDIHRALTMFKEELNDQLCKLEKIKTDRDLNRKEEKIFKELQGNIDSIDAFVEKKLKKVR